MKTGRVEEASEPLVDLDEARSDSPIACALLCVRKSYPL